MFSVFVLATLMTISSFADLVDSGVTVSAEAQKLEHQKTLIRLDDSKIKRLAEIYFLTSRCSDLRTLLAERSEVSKNIYCACGGSGCEKNPYIELKNRLSKGEDFNSNENQKLWNESRELFANETKYMVLKELRKRQSGGEEISKSLSAKLIDWENELDALER